MVQRLYKHGSEHAGMRNLLVLLSGVFVLSLCGGCSDPESGYKPQPVMTEAEKQERIKGIMNNPNIPPGVKGMAISALGANGAKPGLGAKK